MLPENIAREHCQRTLDKKKQRNLSGAAPPSAVVMAIVIV